MPFGLASDGRLFSQFWDLWPFGHVINDLHFANVGFLLPFLASLTIWSFGRLAIVILAMWLPCPRRYSLSICHLVYLYFRVEIPMLVKSLLAICFDLFGLLYALRT